MGNSTRVLLPHTHLKKPTTMNCNTCPVQASGACWRESDACSSVSACTVDEKCGPSSGLPTKVPTGRISRQGYRLFQAQSIVLTMRCQGQRRPTDEDVLQKRVLHSKDPCHQNCPRTRGDPGYSTTSYSPESPDDSN